MRFFICSDIRNPYQFGTHLQMELHAGFQFDGTGKELTGWDCDSTSSGEAQLVNDFLDDGGIVLLESVFSPLIDNIDVPVAGNGRKGDQSDKKCGQYLFHDRSGTKVLLQKDAASSNTCHRLRKRRRLSE